MSSSDWLLLQVLTPEGEVFRKEKLTAARILLADGGYMGIRPGHAPLTGETARGAVRFRTEEGHDEIELLPGVVDIRNNTVIILTAGEVNQSQHQPPDPEETALDRLMFTLVRTLVPENEDELGQK